MVKSGTLEEHFSEIFTATLGKHLGFDMAEYALSGAYVVSRDFTEGRLNFEPMANLVQDLSLIHILGAPKAGATGVFPACACVYGRPSADAGWL